MDKPDHGRIAVETLERALAEQNPDLVYKTADALYGIARPGVWAGEIEVLLKRLPSHDRAGIRRAAKAIAASVRPEGGAARRSAGALPVLGRQGTTWWLAVDGGYVPVSGEILRQELERAHPELPSTVITARGDERPAKPGELYDLVGGVRIDALVWEMGAKVARWDPTSATLIVPCCPLRAGRAERSVRVEAWLERLVGDRLARLLDWIAMHVHLGQPIAALYLDGPPGCGKGLLVAAICALWGGERSSYDEIVLKGWTSGLRRTPIVFLNERAARDRDERGSAAFRDLVGESIFELREKMIPAATIRGCPRMVIAANGPDALRFGSEDLSAYDEQAIGERIVHLPIRAEGRQYLETIGGRSETEGWAELDGELVAHLRWVIQTRKVKPHTRWLVAGDDAAWIRGHAHRDGLPQRILLAVAQVACGVLPLNAPVVVRWDNGYAWVSCSALRTSWATLTGEERVPTLTALGRALGRVGVRQRSADQTWWYRLELQAVIEVCELVGLDSSQVLRKAGRTNAAK